MFFDFFKGDFDYIDITGMDVVLIIDMVLELDLEENEKKKKEKKEKVVCFEPLEFYSKLLVRSMRIMCNINS